MGERILNLLRQGWSYNAIVAEVGCSKSNVNYYAKKLGTAKNHCVYDWKAVQEFHDQGNNMTECRKQFGFCTDCLGQSGPAGRVEAAPVADPD